MTDRLDIKKALEESDEKALEEVITTIVDIKVKQELERQKEEVRKAIKYFSAGFLLLSGGVLAVLAGFPGYITKTILNNEDIKKEVYAFSIKSFDNDEIKSKAYSAVKKEFITRSDKDFRDQIVNSEVKNKIGDNIVDNRLPKVGLDKLEEVTKALPDFTWETLTKNDEKSKKIDEFLKDGKFIEALKDNYYEKIIVLYESAAKTDQDEHVMLLKKRGQEGDEVDIEGIGMIYEGKASNCPNNIINHSKKQAIVVLPNPKLTLEKYPDIENIQKLQFKHLRCNSSVFPYLTLKIKIRGNQKVEDIDLVGVEIRDNFISRQPLLRVTQAVSRELALPYAEPNNVVSASGRVYIQDAEYP